MGFAEAFRRVRMAFRAVRFDNKLYQETLGGLKVASGATVTQEQALKLSAMLRAITIIAGSISTVPLKVMQRTGPDAQESAQQHPVYSLVHDAPNKRMTASEWRFDMAVHMILWGGAVSQIVMNGKADVTAIWPLHPTRVRVLDTSADDWIYRYTRPDGSTRDFSEAEILYIPWLVEGRSMFDHAAEVIGLSLSADQFAGRYFAGGGVQPHALKTDQVVAVEKKREIQNAWHEAQKSARIPFLDAGTDVKDLGSKPAEVQLLEARRFAIEEVGRVTGVPPHLLGNLDRATNNNIEHQGIDFVTHCLSHYAERIEQRMNISLLGPRQQSRYFIEHNLDGLQRGDYKSRAEGAARLVTTGIMTPDEARKTFGLPPADGGDKLYIQGAMVPIEKAGQQPMKGGSDADSKSAGTES